MIYRVDQNGLDDGLDESFGRKQVVGGLEVAGSPEAGGAGVPGRQLVGCPGIPWIPCSHDRN